MDVHKCRRTVLSHDDRLHEAACYMFTSCGCVLTVLFRGQGGDHSPVFLRPNVTRYVITGLSFGTSYHAYLEAVFDHNVATGHSKSLASWILIAKTKGVGPDSRTLCQLCRLLVIWLFASFLSELHWLITRKLACIACLCTVCKEAKR